MTGVDEIALAGRAANGDADAFGALVDRHAPMARRVAYTILEDQQDADDAAQEGFLSAWQAIKREASGRVNGLVLDLRRNPGGSPRAPTGPGACRSPKPSWTRPAGC